VSISKFSGNPEALPVQLWPERVERERGREVGPAPMGVVVPGVPGAVEEEPLTEVTLVSVGKRAGSLILERIHCCTRWMYCAAGILMGFLALSSHVYV
jgi:hypothetical protein